ncbi:MAG: hypothetical protein WA874_16760 [Chryseosolibacter sp.]
MRFLRNLVCLMVLVALMSTICTGLTTAWTEQNYPGRTVVHSKELPLYAAINPVPAEIVEEASVGGEAHAERLQFIELANLSSVAVYLSGLHSHSLLHRKYICGIPSVLYKLFEVFLI